MPASTSQGSKGEGESEMGHPQAPISSPLCEQESSSKSTEAVPEETTPTTGDLPTGSQDAAIVHTTEDELRSLN